METSADRLKEFKKIVARSKAQKSSERTLRLKEVHEKTSFFRTT